MFKFNNGNGAIICDRCRRIIKTPATIDESTEHDECERCQKRIPDNEFTNDLEYQKSMDTAWHYWLQDKYAEQFKAWEAKFKKGSCSNIMNKAKE